MDNRQIVSTIISEEQQENIKELFSKRCKTLGVKYRSKTYYTAQAEFIAGVNTGLLVLNYTIPPIWTICCLTNREIIEDYSPKITKTKKNG